MKSHCASSWVTFSPGPVTGRIRSPTASRRFDSDRYDVVVSDIHMPGLDGWTVARGVRAMRPDVGVVLMSGVPIDGSRSGVAQQRTLEDFVWLGKPFAVAALIAAVNQSLKRRPLAS